MKRTLLAVGLTLLVASSARAQTNTPVNTATRTATNTPTQTPTITDTPTQTPTLTNTQTPTVTNTSTATPTIACNAHPNRVAQGQAPLYVHLTYTTPVALAPTPRGTPGQQVNRFDFLTVGASTACTVTFVFGSETGIVPFAAAGYEVIPAGFCGIGLSTVTTSNGTVDVSGYTWTDTP